MGAFFFLDVDLTAMNDFDAARSDGEVDRVTIENTDASCERSATLFVMFLTRKHFMGSLDRGA
jgi:hypothetical protein